MDGRVHDQRLPGHLKNQVVASRPSVRETAGTPYRLDGLIPERVQSRDKEASLMKKDQPVNPSSRQNTLLAVTAIRPFSKGFNWAGHFSLLLNPWIWRRRCGVM